MPPAQEVMVYDLDGNLTRDLRWDCIWDGESSRGTEARRTADFEGCPARVRARVECPNQNRLKGMETTVVARLAGVPWVRLGFAYDAQGRRIGMKVWRMGGGPALGSGGGILVLRESWRFVYDGWNMIAEYQVPVVAGAEAASAGGLAGCALRRSYQWGLDVSGTQTGAGGVGGLLAVHRHGAGAGATATGTATMTGTFLPCYDGNGNVTELVNWTSTTVVSARYEYSPFGETVLQEGEAIAGENPFRFSTKYTDGETGLVYYGYRYYAPEVGRWLGRDPIGIRGGFNLYGMVGNDAVNDLDVLGLEKGGSLNWEKKGSLYEREGDFDLDDRADGLYNPNAHNFPVAHYSAKISVTCDSEGDMTKASWDFSASTAASAKFNLDISVEQDEGIEGKNVYVAYATATYSGSMFQIASRWAENVSGVGGKVGLGWAGSLVGGIAGGLAGLNADNVNAKSHIKVQVTCVCDKGKWSPKISIVEQDDSATGDNYWR